MYYKDWAPTPFDARGLALDNRQDWLVAPVLRARDSGTLDLSNFRMTLKRLGGESATVEVHRFRHWGPGWIEIILVHPARAADVEAIEKSLERYPLLDEMDYSALEWEKASNYWQSLPRRWRIEWCVKYGISIFAARRDTLPDDMPSDGISGLAE